MIIKKITVQFQLKIVCSHRPDIGIETIFQFEFDDFKKITLNDYCNNFNHKYTWSGDSISKEEQENIKQILKTGMMIDVITDYKNAFLMSKVNNLKSNLYITDEKITN